MPSYDKFLGSRHDGALGFGSSVDPADELWTAPTDSALQRANDLSGGAYALDPSAYALPAGLPAPPDQRRDRLDMGGPTPLAPPRPSLAYEPQMPAPPRPDLGARGALAQAPPPASAQVSQAPEQLYSPAPQYTPVPAQEPLPGPRADLVPPKLATPNAAPGGPPGALSDRDVQAGITRQLLAEQLHGTPGYYSPGGDVARARTVQAQPGPSPELLRRLEDQEREVGKYERWSDSIKARHAAFQGDVLEDAARQAELDNANRAAMQHAKEQKLAPILRQIEELKAVQDKPLDPNAAWNSKSDEKKALALVGVFLGAFSPSGKNDALAILQAENERFIDAQKHNAERAGKRLDYYAKLYKTTADAFDSAQAGRDAVAAARIGEYREKLAIEAAKVQGAEARNRADMFDDQLKKMQDERLVRLDELAHGTVSTQYAIEQAGYRGGKGRDLAKAAKTAGELADLTEGKGDKQSVKYGGQRWGLHSIETGEAKDARKKLVLVDAARNELDKIDKARESFDKGVIDSAQRDLAIKNASSALSVITEQGVIMGGEAEAYKKIYSSMLAGSGPTQDTRQFLDRIATATLEQLDARPLNAGAGGEAAARSREAQRKYFGSGAGDRPAPSPGEAAAKKGASAPKPYPTKPTFGGKR